RKMLLGVDRLDYTKGIPARLEAFEWMLEHQPSLRGRAVFVQVAAPTRTEIEDYRLLAEQVRARVHAINTRFATENWQPVQLIEHSLRLEILVALYRIADVAVVSSLYDGLNLVAKEYVAARVDGDGALCLSETAGAYNELRDAFPLSPLMPERMAEGILRALAAGPEERQERMRRLQAAVHQNTIDTWLTGAVQGIRRSRPDRFNTQMSN
ncbi:Alpha,alpha-trehalose-phosphate synthase (UDP- forming), partial [mine drainage metagenome]